MTFMDHVNLTRKYGGAVHKTDINQSEIMKSSPYYPEKFTGELYDKGARFSRPLYIFMTHLDFNTQVNELKVPAYFFCGLYDYVTPAKQVEEYYRILKAPHKEIVWFAESAHRMDIEEPEKFQNKIIEIAEKHTR